MFPWHHSSGSWPPSSSPTPTAPTWPPTAPPTTTPPHPSVVWSTPSPSTTPPAVHHHPGYQLEQPHYPTNPTTLPTLSTGSTDHLFGHPSALQPSWPTTTSMSTTTSSPAPTPLTFSTPTNQPSTAPTPHHIFPTAPSSTRFEVPILFHHHCQLLLLIPDRPSPDHSNPFLHQSQPPTVYIPLLMLHLQQPRHFLVQLSQRLHRHQHLFQLFPNTLPSRRPQGFALTNVLTSLVVPPNHRSLLLQLPNILQFHLLFNMIWSTWAPLQRSWLNLSASSNNTNNSSSSSLNASESTATASSAPSTDYATYVTTIYICPCSQSPTN